MLTVLTQQPRDSPPSFVVTNGEGGAIGIPLEICLPSDETALRLLLSSQRKRERIPALPKFRSGGALVDVANRDALYHAMEGR
jgi:hypothetical protein